MRIALRRPTASSALGLMLLLLAGRAAAVEYTLTIDPPPAGLSEAKFELWLPDGLPAGQPIRGMIGSSDYHDGANVLTSSEWRGFAGARGMGIIRYLVRVGSDPIGTNQASANAVLTALTQFAGMAGRPELQYTCLVPTGLSWGAHQVCQFHRHIPGRVIASIAFRGTASDVQLAASTAESRLIPLLHKSAGQESYNGYRTEQSHTAFASMGTSGQALHGSTFANTVGPDEPHHVFGDLTFVLAWLDAVVAARLPATIPASGPVTLRALDQTIGWSGFYDVGTSIAAAPWNGGRGFINARIAPCTGGVRPADIRTWLPNQAVANAWLTYAQTGALSAGPAAPTITSQPASVSVMAGQTATFSVSAVGNPAPTYQWQRNGTAISGATGASYTTPATVIGNNGATYRCVVSNASGSTTSTSATLTVTPVTLRVPENPSGVVAGLTYAFYTVSGNGALPVFSTLTPAATGTVATIDLAPRTRDDHYAFVFSGFLDVPTDGVYTLFTTSDDGSRLLIGTTTVVDNDGAHAMQERSGAIGLKAGRHALTVQFAQGNGGQGLEVRWQGPGLAKEVVPASAFFTSGSGGGGSADTTPPAKPATPGVAGNGTVSPVLSGTTEAGATITLRAGGTAVATTTAGGSGAWTLTPTLSAGTHTLTVTARDAAGNTSASSDPFTVTVAAGVGGGSGLGGGASSDGGGGCGAGSGLAVVMLVLGALLVASLRAEVRSP